MGLHFHVKFEGDATYTDITKFVEYNSVSFNSSLCNDKFKFVQDTVKAQTTYNKEINDKFFTATRYMPAYIVFDLQDEQMYGYENGSGYGFGDGYYGFLSPGRIFTGAIYPNTKEVLRDYSTEGVSFEIVDNAYTIDKDCEAFSYPQLLSHTWKVFDPSDKAWSLIHQLLYKAGIDDSMISPVGSITKTVEHISKEEGDDTYLKIINDILYEHHHVAYFDRNGIFCIYDWAHATINIEKTITEADMLDASGVERERNIIDYDGYKVIYKPLSTKERGLVYREDIDEDGKLLLEDGYFPVDGAIKDIYQSFTNQYLSEDAKILNTFNHVLEVTKDDGIVIQSEFYESTQAKVLLKNVLTEDQRLFQLDIRADVVYEDGEEEFTVPSTAKKLDKDITFNYIFNESDAKEFANSLYNNIIKNGSYKYTFTSLNSYDIGKKYNIVTRDYDKNILILSKSWDDHIKSYKYNCIGVAQRVIQIGRIKGFKMSSMQAIGQGIESITERYAISTSKTTAPSSGWSDTAPTWSVGKYLWTRSKIVYKNPADTKYTTPFCDTSWEAVNEIQVGGRNYYSPSILKTLALSSTVVSSTLYRGFYIPVKEGDIWTLSREAITNNRFRYVFTEDEPTAGTTYFGGTGNSTTYDSSLIIKGIEVPPYAKYLFVYLSNQGDDIPKIKLEKGNQATDWTPAPEELEGIVDKSVKTSDVEYYLSTSSTALSGGSWVTTAPQWVDGKFMWSRTKTTLNEGTVSYSPSEGGTSIQTMIPPQPKMIALTGDTPTILYSSRGELKTNEVLFTVTPTNIDYADIVWTCNLGDELLEDILDEFGNPIVNQKTIVAEDITEGPVVVTVYAIIDGVTYSASYSVAVVSEGLPKPMYLDARTDIPLVTEEGPLAKGDFFLYIGEYDGPNTEPVPPTDKTNPLYLNPTLTETNEFVYGRMYEYIGKDSIGTDLWEETRKSECFASAQKDALEIAKNSGVYLYVAVVVAQLGLFNDLLVANNLSSTNYDEYKEEDRETNPASPNYNKIIGLDGKEHEVGEPKKGFKLDGPEDIIKAYAMEAYNSKIFGTVESTGFKTLTGTEPVTIPADDIPKTLWKYSDMSELVRDQDYLYNISGTIEGFSFDKAARRTNKRIKLAEHGYESESISAGESHAFTKLYPSFAFGNTFRCKYSGYYKGVNSFRRYLSNVRNNSTGVFSNSGAANYLDGMDTSYTVEKTHRLDRSGENCVWVNHASTALFGNRGSHVNYNQVWTEQIFTGLVLVNGESSYRVIQFKPTAYYPNTITWNIGANNQNTLSNYVSGTEFYNKFYELPSVADGYVNDGKIKVKRIGQPLTEYTVTRLVKDGNGISFYTNSGIVRVNKFSEGTNSGVYEHLEITQDIKFKIVPDGIEVKSVLPWGTFVNDVENVTIGTVDARFESGYFKYLDVLANLNVTGAISGASVNTGYGANDVFKTSTQSISADATTAQLSAMDIGEVRYVYYSCSSYDGTARLKTPAGGNFYISSIVYLSGGQDKLQPSGSYAGNTNFATFAGSGSVMGAFIIRRNS